ncbi:MAG: transcription antitermination factor NusB [Acidobacteria bacterium]|nr:transcription antitermination factor NusB [Acidobacteriota bacterium]
MLYQWEASKDEPAEIQVRYWAAAKRATGRDFADSLFSGTVATLPQIDELLRAHSQHWRLERMVATDRNILRLAVHELQAHPETPRAVIINEALEIARKFSTPDSVQFINGVLDAIRRTLEAGQQGLRGE